MDGYAHSERNEYKTLLFDDLIFITYGIILQAFASFTSAI